MGSSIVSLLFVFICIAPYAYAQCLTNVYVDGIMGVDLYPMVDGSSSMPFQSLSYPLTSVPLCDNATIFLQMGAYSGLISPLFLAEGIRITTAPGVLPTDISLDLEVEFTYGVTFQGLLLNTITATDSVLTFENCTIDTPIVLAPLLMVVSIQGLSIVTFNNCSFFHGGGLFGNFFSDSSDLILKNSIIAFKGLGNHAIETTGGSILIDSCKFLDNIGGLSATNTLVTITNTLFDGSQTFSAVRVTQGSLTVRNCQFTNNNFATTDFSYCIGSSIMYCGGSAIAAYRTTAVTVTDSFFDSNVATYTALALPIDQHTVGTILVVLPITIFGCPIVISNCTLTNSYASGSLYGNPYSVQSIGIYGGVSLVEVSGVTVENEEMSLANGMMGSVTVVPEIFPTPRYVIFHNCKFLNGKLPPLRIACPSCQNVTLSSVEISNHDSSMVYTLDTTLVSIVSSGVVIKNSSFRNLKGKFMTLSTLGDVDMENNIFQDMQVDNGIEFPTIITLKMSNSRFEDWSTGTGVLNFPDGCPDCLLTNVIFTGITSNYPFIDSGSIVRLAPQVSLPPDFPILSFLTFHGCNFSNALVYSVIIHSGQLDMTDCHIENTQTLQATVVASGFDGSWFITGSTFISNVAGYGVIGVDTYPDMWVLLTDCHFENNYAVMQGGALVLKSVNSVIDHCTFVGNTGGRIGGGAIYVGSFLGMQPTSMIYSCTFRDNHADILSASGGAIAIVMQGDTSATAYVEIYDSTFENCTSPLGGAINVIIEGSNFVANTVLKVFNTTFSHNTADQGGAIAVGSFSDVFFNSSSFISNYARNNGGSVYAQEARMVMEKCTFQGSGSAITGGAVSLKSTSPFAYAIFNEVDFDSNYAVIGEGGGAYCVVSGPTMFEKCNFINNTAPDSTGGAVFFTMYSQPEFTDSTFTNNSAFEGGAIGMNLYSSPVIRNTAFINNQALTTGGAVLCTSKTKASFFGVIFEKNSGTDGGAVMIEGDSHAEFSNCSFLQNSAMSDGGAIYSSSTFPDSPHIRESVFEGNSAENGGGVSCTNSVTMSCKECTFTRNSASDSGGSFHVDQRCKCEVKDSELDRNVATASGGGIYCGPAATVRLENSTISGNNASTGGGIQWGPPLSSTGVTVASQLHAGTSLAAISGSVVINTSSFENNYAVLGGAVGTTGPNVLIRDTSFSNNIAMYGGGVYIVGEISGNFSGNSFSSCRADIAGGGYFWDISAASLSSVLECDYCNYNSNDAAYGPNFGTGAVAQVFSANLSTPDLTINNGQVGPIVLRVLDAYGQLVTSSYVPIFSQVSLPDSSGGDVLGATIVYSYSGIVTFPTVNIQGRFGHIYPLSFSMSGTPSINVNVSLEGCTMGQEGYNSSNFQMCRDCAQGFYNINGNNKCNPCPENAICPGGAYIVAEENYWLLNRNGYASTYDCPDGFCAKNGTCAEHRSGLLCGKCEDGYQNSDGVCIECETTDPGSLFGNLLVLWLFITLLQLTSKAPAGNNSETYISGLPKIVLFFLQTIPFVVTPHRRIRKFFSVFNFQFIFNFADKCSFKADFYQNFLIYILLPGILFCFLMVNLLIHICVHQVVRNSKSRYLKYFALEKSWYIRTLTSLLLFSYTEVTQNVILFLNCRTIGDHRVVAASPDVSCRSSQYKHFSVLAYLLLAFYVLLFPISLGIFLAWAKKGKKFATEQFATYSGLLYQCFKSDYFFWEVIILIRRLIVIGVWVLAYSTTAARNLALFIFTYIMLMVHSRCEPFASKLENDVETALLSILVLLAGIGTSQAYVQYDDEISIFTSVLVFLAVIPVGLAVYRLVIALLVRFGIAPDLPKRTVAFLRESTSSSLKLSSSSVPLNSSGSRIMRVSGVELQETNSRDF